MKDEKNNIRIVRNRSKEKPIINIKTNNQHLNKSQSLPMLEISNTKNESSPSNKNNHRNGLSDGYWVFNLRLYKKNVKSKDKYIGAPPSFFDEDQKKYIEQMRLDRAKKIPFKRNMKEYSHIIENRAAMPLNSTTLIFETTLRSENSTKKPLAMNNIADWKSLAFSDTKSLFDDYLPPRLQQSINQLKLNNKFISRPLEQKAFEGFVNGDRIRVRKFELDQNRTLRYPAEHFPSSPYNNKFDIKNLNLLRIIEKERPIENESYKWNTSLRSFSVPHSPSNSKLATKRDEVVN